MAAVEQAVHAAKWIRMVEGKLDVCEAFRPTPLNDPHLEFHFPAANNPVLHHRNPKSDRKTGAIYVQHITGYSGDAVYKERAKLMEKAGFDCLRSRRGEDGLTWEIWYLASPILGKGPIKNMKTSEDIRKWLFDNVNPGEVSIEGEHWGLGIE